MLRIFYNFLAVSILTAVNFGCSNGAHVSAPASVSTDAVLNAYQDYAATPLAARKQWYAAVGAIPMKSFLADGLGIPANDHVAALLAAHFATVGSLWAAAGVDPTRLTQADFQAALTQGASTGLALADASTSGLTVTPNHDGDCGKLFNNLGKKYGAYVAGPMAQGLQDLSARNSSLNTSPPLFFIATVAGKSISYSYTPGKNWFGQTTPGKIMDRLYGTSIPDTCFDFTDASGNTVAGGSSANPNAGSATDSTQAQPDLISLMDQ